MKWYQWWACECVTGIALWIALWPLSLRRFVISGLLVIAFAIFYGQRIRAQKEPSCPTR